MFHASIRLEHSQENICGWFSSEIIFICSKIYYFYFFYKIIIKDRIIVTSSSLLGSFATWNSLIHAMYVSFVL